MNRKELISVIIPVYNAEKFLTDCLESICSQTYKKLEIICVNDGSNDGSLDVLKEFARKDSRIKIIDKRNEGVSQARNDALKVISGDYIMFVDSDDWIDRNTCEKVVDVAINENADVVMWSYISETEVRSTKKDIFESKKIFEGEDVKKKIHRRYIGIIDDELARPELADALCPVWGKLYKKEVLKGLGFIDLNEIGSYEDGLFNLQVFGRVDKTVYLPEYFYHYRRLTANSVTSGYRENLFEQWQNLFRRMDVYIKQNNLPEQYKEALANRIALSILGLGLNIIGASQNTAWKIKEIKGVVSRTEYQRSYRNLDFRYFPLHWKLFYGCAKHQCAFGLYVLLLVIQKMIFR